MSNFGGRLLTLRYFPQIALKHVYQLFPMQFYFKVIAEFGFVFKIAKVSSLGSGQELGGEQNSTVSGQLSQNAVTLYAILPT